MEDSQPQNITYFPPDARRIVVIGTSGSGKSTLASQLARHFNTTYVEFDAFRHGPNWVETPDDKFRELLIDALKGDTWVADGNYRVVRDMVWRRATTLVWLDYPVVVPLWRVFWRTMHRGIMRVELWNGNREKLWWHFVTKDSLFLWVIRTHWSRRKLTPMALQQPEYSHLNVIRFCSPGATKKWLKEITKTSL